MSSAPRRCLKSLIKRFRNTPIESVPEMVPEPFVGPPKLTDPVTAYYQHKAHNNLRVLYRFAIQTRSLAIRDVLAKASSDRNLDLADLIQVIDNNLPRAHSNDAKRSLGSLFDNSVLLVLADLLANTARDDLDTHAAVKIYDFVHATEGHSSFTDQQVLLYVEALNEAGDYAKAQQLASDHSISEFAPLQPELLHIQRIRRTSVSSNEWMNTLNEMFAALDLTQVQLLDDDSAPLLDRLTAAGGLSLNGPKVSVIMPTFSPGLGIRTAVRGLLEQTWQNLEIIIVDDASPKEYQDIFREMERLDPRIRVLSQAHNAGAYVARNAGLAMATGEFITTTDDDDWSHPDKIASQVLSLLDDPSLVATVSAHIRTTEDLEFCRVNSSAKFLQMNYSSLMFRKQLIDDIGVWDTVNRGADSEFYSRVLEFYGSDRVDRMLEKPLAFSRVRTGSLTSGEMYRGFIGTPRVLYLWAIRQWRWDLGQIDQKPTRFANTTRPYAVPTNFEAGQRNADLGVFDIIYVTDFFRQAKYVKHVLDEITTLLSAGYRVGYLHLDSPNTTSPAGFPKELFQPQVEGRLVQVSLSDTATTNLLLVYDSSIGMFADQIDASLTSNRSLVIDRALPSLVGDSARNPTHLNVALQNLDECFKTKFQVIGAATDDQERVRSETIPGRVLSDEFTWRPHVRRGPGKIMLPKSKPVVGFHSYGNRYRWPTNREVFQKVYHSVYFETIFYGSLDDAISKLGDSVFSNASVISDKEIDEQTFLSMVDFWVYSPHDRLVDKLWEPVLTAMQSGKVVILPPALKNIYLDGAAYATPEETESIIQYLSSDENRFAEQAKRGQAFVGEVYSSRSFLQRVSKLMATPVQA